MAKRCVCVGVPTSTNRKLKMSLLYIDVGGGKELAPITDSVNE